MGSSVIDFNSSDQDAERLKAQETKIQQKVMAAHREAFVQKFPGQCEHIMRLIAERLQLGLRKDSAGISNSEVESLATALLAIYNIHSDLN